MLNFSKFKIKVDSQFDSMRDDDLFMTDVPKDVLWDTYLKSFPAGTNEIYKTRTEHDCQCCKAFIRACGGMVGIRANKIITIWDIDVGGRYQPVADALAKIVKAHKIIAPFYYFQRNLGTDYNIQITESNKNIQWEHFFLKLPKRFILDKDMIGTKISEEVSSKEVFKRSMTEISLKAAEIVLDLISQNSIYRGAEHKGTVELFIKYKKKYILIPGPDMDNYCWQASKKLNHAARIRNTVIGTLLTDISNGVELDSAVKMFETKVAPVNYKRSSAIITKSMIRKAEEQIKTLGIKDALKRRFAIQSDISIKDILFANKAIYKTQSIFDDLIKEAPEKLKNFDKVEEVDIQTFLTDILPRAEEIELLFKLHHTENLMSLIAPEISDAKNILKWNNNFSWAYNGDVTDSIKEKVKRAGGNIEAVLRCSLAWHNYDDLDIHVQEPKGGYHLYFNRRHNISTTGQLDVDMNVDPNDSRNAVENIVWTDKDRMLEGVYKVYVHNYHPRENIDLGFEAEINFEGHSIFISSSQKVRGKILIAEFKFTRKNGIEFLSTLSTTKTTKTIWNLQTEHFHKVSMIMNSPNHWNEKIGNKHYFFILADCENDKPVRGFFNEFLSESLREHRKVFEVLGSKMMIEGDSNQLSGLGFSSTQKNSVLCRISGNFSRTININF